MLASRLRGRTNNVTDEIQPKKRKLCQAALKTSWMLCQMSHSPFLIWQGQSFSGYLKNGLKLFKDDPVARQTVIYWLLEKKLTSDRG